MNNFGEILYDLDNYEELISYNESNIIKGKDWIFQNPFYTLITSPEENKCKKYLNRLGVCSQYMTHQNPEIARKANNKINHILKKMLGYRFINYTPYLQPTAPERYEHKLVIKEPTNQRKIWYYAVRRGRNPGIYTDWSSCSEQVLGFPDAMFKKFPTFREAEQFVNQ